MAIVRDSGSSTPPAPLKKSSSSTPAPPPRKYDPFVKPEAILPREKPYQPGPTAVPHHFVERPLEETMTASRMRALSTPTMVPHGDIDGMDTLDQTRDSFLEWARTEAPQQSVIPAGTDQYGRPRIVSGWGDHEAYDRFRNRSGYETNEGGGKVAGPGTTPPMAMIGHSFAPTSWFEEPAQGESQVEHVVRDVVSPTVGVLGLVNDFNTRFGRLRQDFADNPKTHDDDPKVEYTTPDGKTTFTADQRLTYYQLKNGMIVESGELEQALKNPTGWSLPDGTQFTQSDMDNATGKDWVLVKDKSDPRWEHSAKADDGNRYYAQTLVLPSGKEVARTDVDSARALYELPDRRPLSIDAVPVTDEEWKAAFAGLRAPDRKTVVMNPDGTVPEEVQHMFMRQTNGGILGVANPRAPWQDQAGNNVWDPVFGGEFHPERNTLTEAIPWGIDAMLTSLPYMVHRGYGLLSGAAAAAPYLQGIDGNTYEPTPGWENLGHGTFLDEKITNSQAAGGATAPPLDALAEWNGDKAIGGFEDSILGKLLPEKWRDWLGNTKRGRMISGAIGEGSEELWSQPSNEVEEVGFENYGRPKYMNEQTNRWEFDPTKPGGLFTPSAISGYGHAFASGAAIGLPLQGFEELKHSLRGMPGGFRPTPIDVPDARPNPRPETPTLERRYENEEW